MFWVEVGIVVHARSLKVDGQRSDLMSLSETVEIGTKEVFVCFPYVSEQFVSESTDAINPDYSLIF